MTKNSSVEFVYGRDVFTFSIDAKLVQQAPERPLKDAPWKDTADRWFITLSEKLYGNLVTLDYWTGIGHRQKLYGSCEQGRPVKPSVESVLTSIGMDLSTALDMPAGDADAMDYLQDEFGSEDKPSDLLRMVHALRKTVTKAKTLLRNTGISVSEFSEWAAKLEE